MHVALASLSTGEETVARNEVHFLILFSQQTDFRFESEVAEYSGNLSKEQ